MANVSTIIGSRLVNWKKNIYLCIGIKYRIRTFYQKIVIFYCITVINQLFKILSYIKYLINNQQKSNIRKYKYKTILWCKKLVLT